MNDVVKLSLLAIGGIAVVLFIATLAGTFIWFLWPWALPAIFPGLVKSGVMVPQISWGSAVALSWIMGLLFRSNVSVNKK